MDESDETDFYDTISINSTSSSIKRNRDSIAQSRHTIYHSAEDIELLTMNGGSNDIVGDSPIKHSGANRRDSKNWNRFRDGQKTVDFILVYSPNISNDSEEKRKVFEANLIDEGLILEHEETQRLHFVKIHAPNEVLCRYCEILKLRMPIKEIPGQETICDSSFDLRTICSKLPDIFHVRLDKKLFPVQKYTLTSEYSRDRDYLFDINGENFFTTSIKSMVVNFILERTTYSHNSDAGFDVGINRLLEMGVYLASYPLHDGDYRKPDCMRSLLFREWAQIDKWIKYQPIDYIKDYFGVKYALYFAWLGFYTHMLIPASIFGIICVLYGLITLPNDSFSRDICNSHLNITMCPLCDAQCDYWNLNDACLYSKISYVFDNPCTIVFAIFMSFWAALYLELWKRYSADITHRWGLTGFDLQAEHPRPQYLAKLSKAKKQKMNYVTRVLEPVVPFWKIKFPSIILSFSIAILWISIAIGAVFGVVIYRMSQVTSRNLFGVENDSAVSKVLTVPIMAAVLNLICILVLNLIYDKLAVILTEMEYQRTQTEFDDSLTLKTYMFQFVNYYSCIFYIGFLKGKFVGYPAKYNRLFGYRQEECNPGGCLMELFIQLAIIMIGNQFLSAVSEMIIPYMYKWYNSIRIRTGLARRKDDDLVCCNQWTEDYKLLDWGTRGLFYEYLEMVMQYGFLTIFVVAFPLAPLFALINNIFEMRLDAKKFLKYYRRPVPTRVNSIGVWLPILSVLSRIAIVSNAFILAFSSHFLPRLIYMLTVSPDRTDTGFLNYTLAYFDTNDFQVGAAPLQSAFNNVTMCRYLEYRNPPWHEQKYKRPIAYWHLWVARLAFVVVFQNVVNFGMAVVEWAIPDMSRKLRDQIKRETYLTYEIIIKQEAQRARSVSRQNSFKHNSFNKNDDASTLFHRQSGEAPILEED